MTQSFFRFEYDYIHQTHQQPWIGNAGDMFQTFAVMELYKKAGIDLNELITLNRDDIGTYSGPEGALIMQGYYERTPQMNARPESVQMPASENIRPVFLGFHIADREYYTRPEALAYYQKYSPIGCRDRVTATLLQGLGVNAYFSGCLTLTFDQRAKKATQDTIFIVDVPDKAMRKIPESVRQRAQVRTQKIALPNQGDRRETMAEFEKISRTLFDEYQNRAKLVITKRIHVAMPCIAMGIPVVFIHKNPQNARFDVLHGLTQLYSYRDIKNIPYDDVQAIDIADYKQRIINNALYQLNQTCPELKMASASVESPKELEDFSQKLALKHWHAIQEKKGRRWPWKRSNKKDNDFSAYMDYLTQNVLYEKKGSYSSGK